MTPAKKVTTSKIEPKQRKDGMCVVCGKTIPLVGLRMGDPFCSSTCCRRHYSLDGEE